MTLTKEEMETMLEALDTAKYDLHESLFQAWRQRNKDPERWDNVIKATNRKFEAVKAMEAKMERALAEA